VGLGAAFLLVLLTRLHLESIDELGTYLYLLGILGVAHCVYLAKRDGLRQPQHWSSRWYALGGIALAPVVFALAIRTFLFEPFSMSAGSMIPTLQVGDNLFAKKFAYISSPPARGDIIVFRRPDGTNYVKRLVGLPDDTIRMLEGRVFINGEMIDRQAGEAVVYRDSAGTTRNATRYVETLPGGKSYAILEEGDSRRFDNTAEFKVPASHYFVLGDNRDNSLDSRADIGFVPRAKIRGKAVGIFWNAESKETGYRAVE
jgi:signal peptidase I